MSDLVSLFADVRNARNRLNELCQSLPFWADSGPCLSLVAQVDKDVLEKQSLWLQVARESSSGFERVLRLLQQTRETLQDAAKDIGASLTWSAAWDQVVVQSGKDAVEAAKVGLPIAALVAVGALLLWKR